jgi:integrase/recombinase XerD
MRTNENYTVSEALDTFLRKCTARNLSPNTIEMYKVRLRVFNGFLSGDNIPLTDITRDTLDEYTLYLKESGSRNAVSVNSYLRDLRVFLYFCMEEGHLPSFKIKLPKVDK